MSTAFSKNKEKRPRSSSEPNKSFVKNVTSRVSGLLPATIAKWFSSPSSSKTNGSAQGVEATDSSTEDEAPESPITTQPPAKRMRYASPGNLNELVKVETRCTSTNTESVEDIYHTVHSPIGKNDYKRETNLMSTQINSANEESTDGVIQENSFFKSQHSLSAIGHPVAKKRKSLFDNPTVESSTKRSPTYSSDVRDPYFKPSLLSSPFYVGRTMYGGAASSYMSEPNIKQRKTSLINETSDTDSVTISHSARRVMDLLENYSSPLLDAKRIPPIARNYKKNNSMDTTQQSVNPYGPKVFSYKTQELYVPTVASILTIKRRSRLMDTTNAARQIIASHSSTAEVLPYPKTNYEGNSQHEASSDVLTTKIKSRLTRANRERNAEVECNVADTVNLPTGVLKIDKDNLPRFTFGSSATSQMTQNSSIQTPVITALDSLKRTIETNKSTTYKPNDVESIKPVQGDNNNDLYKFSSPVRASNETTNTTSTLSKFSFGSPERNIDKVQEVKKKDNQLSSNYSNQVIVENKLSVLKSSDWKCLDCWVLNKADVNNCVCCGGKKPVEVAAASKTCSVCKKSHNRHDCEKCDECEKKTNNVDNIFAAKGKNTSKWKCNDCWVDNDDSAVKCVCCGAKNSKKSSPAVINTSANNEDSEWKCNDCWIKNKSTLDKCAACGGLKPGCSSTNSTSGITELPKSTFGISKSSDSTFKNVITSQSEKWECPICLVRNDSDRSMCACCDADKPGTIKESHKRLFNFHQPSEITFKFGIQPKEDENKKQNKNGTEEFNMAQESETNNNFLPKTSTFNFGMPAKKIGDRPEMSTEKPVEVPKINFTFGVAKQDTESLVRNPIFGIPSKAPEITKKSEEKEKPQEVPQVFNPPNVEDQQKKAQDIFSIPVSSHIASEMPALIPLQQTNQPSVTKVETPLSNTSILSTTNSEAKPQQNSFSFSAIRPATNLFATTSTTTTNIAPISLSTPATTSGSLFQTNATTTSTGSFFQKSDSALTTSVSLFPKTDSATTAVAQGITQPVFSFGNQGSMAQPEKPKFNFNFGSGATEPPSLFKPTFGVSSDSTNKFNLSNSITTGNVVPGNPLNSTTQVNVTNPLTTGNSDTPSTPNLFGAAVQKENMWSTSNNMFISNSTPIASAAQKPPTFTFGSATGFNSNNSFGSTTQPTQNVFGMSNQSITSQPLLFGNQLQNQTTANIFGSPQNTNNPMPMTMFGTPNASVTPAFGTQNPTPSFETPVMTPAPAPAFNFGSPQPTGIFGFGQQQQNQVPPEGQQPAQVPQGGMYSFGAPAGPPQLQFNMGSAPNTVGRRVFRKAMRRTQR